MSIKTEKIGSNFVKEISYIIMEEIKDPKIQFVTLTDCDVTNDLSYAKVYFTTLKDEEKE
jgi:ribosome-binding factor A